MARPQQEITKDTFHLVHGEHQQSGFCLEQSVLGAGNRGWIVSDHQGQRETGVSKPGHALPFTDRGKFGCVLIGPEPSFRPAGTMIELRSTSATSGVSPWLGSPVGAGFGLCYRKAKSSVRRAQEWISVRPLKIKNVQFMWKVTMGLRAPPRGGAFSAHFLLWANHVPYLFLVWLSNGVALSGRSHQRGDKR
jgi:hypothetical protein